MSGTQFRSNDKRRSMFSQDHEQNIEMKNQRNTINNYFIFLQIKEDDSKI